MKKRIYFVDFARSFAIVLALLDHSLNDFNIWHNYSQMHHDAIKSFTSSATPTFLFLFGMMLELVYLRKLKENDLPELVQKLFKRSLQCYFGYFLTVIAGVIGGLMTIKQSVAAIVFFGNSHFGNILKLYTFLLLLAIPILLFRAKKGIWYTVFIGLGIWVLYPFLNLIPHVHDNLSIFTSTFFGFGGRSGPSVIFSLSIVVLGMLTANFIDYERKTAFLKHSLQLLIVLLGCIFLFSIFYPPTEIAQNFLNNSFRYENHPLYYLIGTSLAIIITIFFSFLFPVGNEYKGRIQHLLVFGRKSLEAFTLGNVILNLFKTTIDNYTWNIEGPIIFILSVYIILRLYENHQAKRKYMNNEYKACKTLKYQVNRYFFVPITSKISSTFEHEK